MPTLKSIALPSSTISTKDFQTLRTPLPISPPENALEELPNLREALKLRTASLSRIVLAEREVVENIGHGSENLRQIMFSRNVEADDRMEYAVRYTIPRGTPPSDAAYPVKNRLNVMPKPEILSAANDEHTAPLMPQAPPTSLAFTLQQLWAAPPASRRIRRLVASWATVPMFPADVFKMNIDADAVKKSHESNIG